MEEEQMDQEELEILLDFIVDLVLLVIISLFLSYGWGVCVDRVVGYLALLRATFFLFAILLPEVPEHRLREREDAINDLIILTLLRIGILEEEPEH